MRIQIVNKKSSVGPDSKCGENKNESLRLGYIISSLSGSILCIINLFDRTSTVRIGSRLSSPFPCCHGVPRESVSGPLLCTVYVFPLSRITSAQDVVQCQYTDDTQLHIERSSSAILIISLASSRVSFPCTTYFCSIDWFRILS